MWSVWTLLCPLYYKILYVYPCASRTCRYRQGDKLTLSRYYSWGFYALSDDDHQNADEILKLLINPYVLVVQDHASSFGQILLPMSKTCEKNCSVSSAISHRGWSFDLTRLTIEYRRSWIIPGFKCVHRVTIEILKICHARVHFERVQSKISYLFFFFCILTLKGHFSATFSVQRFST